jgi:glycosyltransferase involved in cell wall biosynthesis
VFLFPTLSDGFGLTQLEAQAWKLPVIASRHCGDVVRRGVNGVMLDEVSGQAIADAIRECVMNPPRLLSMSRNARASSFSLDRVRHELKMIHGSPVGETAAHSSVR